MWGEEKGEGLGGYDKIAMEGMLEVNKSSEREFNTFKKVFAILVVQRHNKPYL